jgi:hypothetical protein
MATSERAWVSVTPHIWSPHFYPKWEAGDPVPEGPMGKYPIAHRFPAKITNVGRTPAKIDSIAIRYIRIPSDPSQLSAEPDYGELSPAGGYCLVPRDKATVNATLSQDEGTLTKGQIDAISKRQQFLYAYGIVKYRDVYELPHETRFGYVYYPPDLYYVQKGGEVSSISFDKAVFQRGGPLAYNSNT